jgi:hypothetical protein
MRLHRAAARYPGTAFGSRGTALDFFMLSPILDFPLDRGSRCLYDYAQIPNSELFRFIGSIDPCPKEWRDCTA